MATKSHSHRRAPLEGRARRVFEDLGYSVRYDGDALRAERDEKSVRVLSVDEPEPPSLDGTDDKYCLVTDAEEARALKERADESLPNTVEYAVIGLRDDGYFVA